MRCIFERTNTATAITVPLSVTKCTINKNSSAVAPSSCFPNFSRCYFEGIYNRTIASDQIFNRNTLACKMSDRDENKRGGSKYQPLLDALRRSDQIHVTLTFAEMEVLLGEQLPPSARSKRGWWSNRSKGALQATAWMTAGYLVEAIDLVGEKVTFTKPPQIYRVQCIDDTLQWNSELIRALRLHMGLTQADMAKELGVRQQTVSEWEKGVYAPTRASSKHLTLVAEKAAFRYEVY